MGLSEKWSVQESNVVVSALPGGDGYQVLAKDKSAWPQSTIPGQRNLLGTHEPTEREVAQLIAIRRLLSLAFDKEGAAYLEQSHAEISCIHDAFATRAKGETPKAHGRKETTHAELTEHHYVIGYSQHGVTYVVESLNSAVSECITYQKHRHGRYYGDDTTHLFMNYTKAFLQRMGGVCEQNVETFIDSLTKFSWVLSALVNSRLFLSKQTTTESAGKKEGDQYQEAVWTFGTTVEKIQETIRDAIREARLYAEGRRVAEFVSTAKREATQMDGGAFLGVQRAVFYADGEGRNPAEPPMSLKYFGQHRQDADYKDLTIYESEMGLIDGMAFWPNLHPRLMARAAGYLSEMGESKASAHRNPYSWCNTAGKPYLALEIERQIKARLGDQLSIATAVHGENSVSQLATQINELYRYRFEWKRAQALLDEVVDLTKEVGDLGIAVLYERFKTFVGAYKVLTQKYLAAATALKDGLRCLNTANRATYLEKNAAYRHYFSVFPNHVGAVSQGLTKVLVQVESLERYIEDQAGSAKIKRRQGAARSRIQSAFLTMPVLAAEMYEVAGESVPAEVSAQQAENSRVGHDGCPIIFMNGLPLMATEAAPAGGAGVGSPEMGGTGGGSIVRGSLAATGGARSVSGSMTDGDLLSQAKQRLALLEMSQVVEGDLEAKPDDVTTPKEKQDAVQKEIEALKALIALQEGNGAAPRASSGGSDLNASLDAVDRGEGHSPSRAQHPLVPLRSVPPGYATPQRGSRNSLHMPRHVGAAPASAPMRAQGGLQHATPVAGEVPLEEGQPETVDHEQRTTIDQVRNEFARAIKYTLRDVVPEDNFIAIGKARFPEYRGDATREDIQKVHYNRTLTFCFESAFGKDSAYRVDRETNAFELTAEVEVPDPIKALFNGDHEGLWIDAASGCYCISIESIVGLTTFANACCRPYGVTTTEGLCPSFCEEMFNELKRMQALEDVSRRMVCDTEVSTGVGYARLKEHSVQVKDGSVQTCRFRKEGSSVQYDRFMQLSGRQPLDLFHAVGFKDEDYVGEGKDKPCHTTRNRHQLDTPFVLRLSAAEGVSEDDRKHFKARETVKQVCLVNDHMVALQETFARLKSINMQLESVERAGLEEDDEALLAGLLRSCSSAQLSGHPILAGGVTDMATLRTGIDASKAVITQALGAEGALMVGRSSARGDVVDAKTPLSLMVNGSEDRAGLFDLLAEALEKLAGYLSAHALVEAATAVVPAVSVEQFTENWRRHRTAQRSVRRHDALSPSPSSRAATPLASPAPAAVSVPVLQNPVLAKLEAHVQDLMTKAANDPVLKQMLQAFNGNDIHSVPLPYRVSRDSTLAAGAVGLTAMADFIIPDVSARYQTMPAHARYAYEGLLKARALKGGIDAIKGGCVNGLSAPADMGYFLRNLEYDSPATGKKCGVAEARSRWNTRSGIAAVGAGLFGQCLGSTTNDLLLALGHEATVNRSLYTVLVPSTQ